MSKAAPTVGDVATRELTESDAPTLMERGGQDNTEKDITTPEFGPAPDGGTRAWLVAAGAGCVFFSCFGFSNSFGVFQEYYMNHQLRHESPDRIAWIGSMGAYFSMAGGAIGGPLFDLFGIWVSSPILSLLSSMVATKEQLVTDR
jgi:hypothetical protein